MILLQFTFILYCIGLVIQVSVATNVSLQRNTNND